MTVTSINLKKLLLSVAIPLATGGLSALITMNGFKEYAMMEKPALSPPAWLFPVVWTVLYILMGISSYLVASSKSEDKTQALIIYGVQLFLNFLWPILFFLMKAYLFSFIWLVLLWAFVLAMIVIFYKINKTSGIIQIPYLIWLSFAGYLNLAVFFLN